MQEIPLPSRRPLRPSSPPWASRFLAILSLFSPALVFPLSLHKIQSGQVIEAATRQLEPHGVANYLRELAAAFHGFYNAHKMVDESQPEQSLARLALAEATRQVIANGLKLLGVSAPESM